jgi:hypothetical protein
MAGADIKTVQTISGHKTVAMLMHYAHVFAPHVDQALSILNRGIPDAITPELHTVAGQGDGAVADNIVGIDRKSAV